MTSDAEKAKRFRIRFDFDAENESPSVLICDTHDTFGQAVVEVFEEPILLIDEWSWEESDWKPGPMTEAILKAMNSSDDLGLIAG